MTDSRDRLDARLDDALARLMRRRPRDDFRSRFLARTAAVSGTPASRWLLAAAAVAVLALVPLAMDRAVPPRGPVTAGPAPRATSPPESARRAQAAARGATSVPAATIAAPSVITSAARTAPRPAAAFARQTAGPTDERPPDALFVPPLDTPPPLRIHPLTEPSSPLAPLARAELVIAPLTVEDAIPGQEDRP